MYIDVRIEERDMPKFFEIMSLLGANKEVPKKLIAPIPEFPNLTDEEMDLMFRITNEVRKQIMNCDPTKPMTFTLPPLMDVKVTKKKV